MAIENKNKNIFQLKNEYNGIIETLKELENYSEQQGLEVDYKLFIININEELDEKIGNWGYYLKRSEIELNCIIEERKRLQELERRLANRIEKKKEALKQIMIETDKKRIEHGSITVSIRNNRPSVVIIDESKIPIEYKKEIVETHIEKDKIYNHIKETGEIVEGIEIKESCSIIIK